MANFTEEQKQKILKILSERGASLNCPRCNNANFTLVDGLASISLGDGKTTVIGGPAMPSVVIVCTKCGAVYLHALGVLGLFGEFGFK